MAQELASRLAAYMDGRQGPPYSICTFPDGPSLLGSCGGFLVVFLDIQMEGPNGMETAKLLRQRGDRALLVFVTILQEQVFDAFDVDAYGYLLKPLDSGRFQHLMDRVLAWWQQQAAQPLVVQRGAACQVIPLGSIVYCEVLGRKVYIHQEGGGVVDYYGRLGDLERRLDQRFFKCHRSYLVNLDYLRGCQAGQALLPQGEKIPVSRLRERELAQALLGHMKGRGF